jgi:hypothetical protein
MIVTANQFCDLQDVMMECQSPFLVCLHGTNQDDQTLYMLMEAVMGGELFTYLQVRAVWLKLTARCVLHFPLR